MPACGSSFVTTKAATSTWWQHIPWQRGRVEEKKRRFLGATNANLNWFSTESKATEAPC